MVVSRKPTRMDQIAQEGKYAMLLYYKRGILPEEDSIHTAEMTAMKEMT